MTKKQSNDDTVKSGSEILGDIAIQRGRAFQSVFNTINSIFNSGTTFFCTGNNPEQPNNENKVHYSSGTPYIQNIQKN